MHPVKRKRIFSSSRVIGSSVSAFAGSGSTQVVYPTFSATEGVKYFRSWCYSASMIVANECARVPLRLYVRNRKGKEKNFRSRRVPDRRKGYLYGYGHHRPSTAVVNKVIDLGEDFEEVTDPHPAVSVLQSANEFANGFDLTVLRYVFLQMTGDAYLHTVFDRATDVPSEVWLLPSQDVKIKPSKQTFIAGYEYGYGADRVQFDTDEVIHFKLPNPSNPYYGRGRVEAAWSVLALHHAKRDTDIANFQNRCRPDMLAIMKSTTDQGAADRFTSEMERRLKGSSKAGRFAAVTGDVNIKQLNFPPDDIGDPDRVLDEISSVWGVPRAMLTGNINVAGGGSEQADRGFMRGTIAPLLCFDEQKLNESWLPLFDVGDDAVLAYDNPVPEDRAYELDRRTRLVAGGVMLVNEARQEEGLSPVEDPMADTLLINGAPLGKVGPMGMGVFGLPFDPAQGKPADQAVPNDQPALPQQPPQEQDIETTQEAVLNGAQVTAATAIVVAVAAGEIPRDAGIGQLEVLFNLSTEQAERIMGSAGTDTPTTPNPKPQMEQEQEQPEPQPTLEAATDGIGKAVRDALMKVLDEYELKRKASYGESVLPGVREDDGVGALDPDNGALPGDDRRDVVVRELPPPNPPGAQHLPVAKETLLGSFLDSAFVKALADDTAREGEPESIGARMTRLIAAILAESGARVTAIIDPPEVAKRLDQSSQELIEQEVRAMGERIGEDIRPLIERIIAEGGTQGLEALRQAIEAIGIDVPRFDQGNPAVSSAARSFTERLAGEVSQATIDKVRDAIARGIEAGESSADLARRVRDTGSFERARAEAIARTESARAYGEGKLEAWEQSGVVEGKVFQLAVGACPTCEAFADSVRGQVFGLRQALLPKGGVVRSSSGEVLLVNDYADMQSGGVHPQCRCDVEAVLIQPERAA